MFNITLTEGLVLRGDITHAEGQGLSPSNYFVISTLYIGNVLYTVSNAKVSACANNLEDLAFIKEIKLN